MVEVRVAALARPEVGVEEVRIFPTWPAPRRVRLWRVGGHEVWGVTYRILEPLVPRLLEGNGRCDDHPAATPSRGRVGLRVFMSACKADRPTGE